MPVSPLAISGLGFLVSGLQALAAKLVWNLSRRGAVLAGAILAFRLAVLGLQSLLVLTEGADFLTLAGMVASLLVGLAIVALLTLSWRRMS